MACGTFELSLAALGILVGFPGRHWDAIPLPSETFQRCGFSRPLVRETHASLTSLMSTEPLARDTGRYKIP